MTAAPRRWECECSEPAILLGIIDERGVLEVKGRPRQYIRIAGNVTVTATCRHCRREHTLVIEQRKEQAA